LNRALGRFTAAASLHTKRRFLTLEDDLETAFHMSKGLRDVGRAMRCSPGHVAETRLAVAANVFRPLP
jgi:hypothetical protein